jgi:cytochrome c oxidase subunit 4
MTLAQSRGIKKPPEPEHEPAHEQAHPGPMEYVQIGAILAVVTAIEVAIYYVDALADVLVPILIVLSAAKFGLVVLWFMHLKFDSRLFSWMFVGGIALASTLFVVVLATLGSGLT